MDIILFGTYVFAIISLSVIISIIVLAWRDYFPRRWIIFISATFILMIVGLCFLLGSELVAPYNSFFYLNPFLYLIYLSFLGGSLFSVYLLAHEIYFDFSQIVRIIGIIAFSLMVLLLIISGILLLIPFNTTYPWTAYVSIEIVYGLGISSYALIAAGSFRDASSKRLEKKYRRGLILIGIFATGIASALIWVSMGAFYANYSMPLHPYITEFWLLWLVFVDILYMFFVRAAANVIA
ncbi:MAG: hypothetical protein ACTSRW_02780 [Candidatus Helarchaeota archaeon]